MRKKEKLMRKFCKYNLKAYARARVKSLSQSQRIIPRIIETKLTSFLSVADAYNNTEII